MLMRRLLSGQSAQPQMDLQARGAAMAVVRGQIGEALTAPTMVEVGTVAKMAVRGQPVLWELPDLLVHRQPNFN